MVERSHESIIERLLPSFLRFNQRTHAAGGSGLRSTRAFETACLAELQNVFRRSVIGAASHRDAGIVMSPPSLELISSRVIMRLKKFVGGIYCLSLMTMIRWWSAMRNRRHLPGASLSAPSMTRTIEKIDRTGGRDLATVIWLTRKMSLTSLYGVPADVFISWRSGTAADADGRPVRRLNVDSRRAPLRDLCRRPMNRATSAPPAGRDRSLQARQIAAMKFFQQAWQKRAPISKRASSGSSSSKASALGRSDGDRWRGIPRFGFGELGPSSKRLWVSGPSVVMLAPRVEVDHCKGNLVNKIAAMSRSRNLIVFAKKILVTSSRLASRRPPFVAAAPSRAIPRMCSLSRCGSKAARSLICP